MSDITRTIADTSGFIPMYWANRALDVLRANIVFAQNVARDTDFSQAGWEGKSITVPYPGTFTANAKVAGTPLTPQVPVGGQSVTLTLDHHRAVPFLVEDLGSAVASGSLFERYIEPATVAIAEDFENSLWMTALQAGTLSPIGTAATDLTSTVSRSAMVNLNKAKAPRANRSLVISAKDEASVLGDSNLATYFAFSQADSLRNGYVGRLYTFDVYMSQLAPLGYTVTMSGNSTFTFNSQTTPSQTAAGLTAATLQTALGALTSVGAGLVSVSGAAGGPFSVVFDPSIDGTGTLTASTATPARSQQNAAIHKNAIMYACRPFEPIPDSAGVMTATATDPESGLAIRIATQYDINNQGMRCNLDVLYGVTVLRPSQAQVIAS